MTNKMKKIEQKEKDLQSAKSKVEEAAAEGNFERKQR
jgi:hypothetical protein